MENLNEDYIELKDYVEYINKNSLWKTNLQNSKQKFYSSLKNNEFEGNVIKKDNTI